ncbi:MAG: hypothetical protein COB60_11180 [Flavobacteriaceae bacterium]|nr:MAG: hypothetical protein COB60_11180 [Flavobacteriaceae bacterium]
MEKLLKSEGMAFKVVLIKIIPYQINKNNIMKKVMYVCLMVAMMPFVSCDKEDDEVDSIVGVWEEISEIKNEYTNGVLEKTKNYTLDEGKIAEIEFKSDNTYKEYFSYQIDGSTEIDEETFYATYEIVDNKIIYDYADEDELTETTFVLKGDILVLTSLNPYEDGKFVEEFITTYRRK